jgi:hypothetical protein
MFVDTEPLLFFRHRDIVRRDFGQFYDCTSYDSEVLCAMCRVLSRDECRMQVFVLTSNINSFVVPGIVHLAAAYASTSLSEEDDESLLSSLL